MLRASSAAAIATAVLMLVPASPGHALTGSDLECQTTIGTAARTFAAAKHKAIVECNNALVGGQRCNAARRDKRILKALDKMARSVVSACRRTALGDLGFPGQCFDPTFDDFSLGDLTDCLDQSHSSSVDFVFVPVEYPHPLGLFGDERRCQRVIGSASQIFVAHELRARAQCLNDQLRQKLPATVDCRAEAPGTGDDDTDKRLIAAGNDLFTRLLDACAGVALDHLGFPGFCFDATGGAFDVTDLRRCIREIHASLAGQLTAIEYPAASSSHSPTPTPVGPTPVPTPGGPCDFTAARFVPDGFGSDLDLGWTGLLHNQRLVTDAALSFTVTGCDSAVQPCVCRFEGPVANRDAENGVIDNHRCVGDTAVHCTSDDQCGGDGPCAYFFGSTLPVSGGGVGTCITNQIDGAVSGSVDTGSGAAGVALALVARISTGLDFAAPCPVCAGDPFPNDGIREGVCGGGLHDGDRCDANGRSPVPSFGVTSLDCPPNPGAEIAALDLQWDLTTGTTVRTLTASSPTCTDFGVADRKCFCAGAGAPTRPNACIDDTATPEDESLCSGFFEQGFCAGGPVDQACAIESFRGCLNDQDCPAPFDFCVARARECYADNGFVGGSVSASGTTDPFFGGSAFPTFAALFCTGPTSSAAVNYSTGLPGLGRLRLPGELRLSTEQP